MASRSAPPRLGPVGTVVASSRAMAPPRSSSFGPSRPQW